MTDENGRFQCMEVRSGRFDITVSLLGYQTKLLTVHTDSFETDAGISLEEQTFESQEVIISGSKYSLQHENAVDIQSIKLDERSELKTNFLQNLSKQPGIDMISKGNGLQKPVIRGLSNTNILVVDNGIRKENYQFSENHPYLIDDNGTERIEIIKGPASLLDGSDAVGGVIPHYPFIIALEISNLFNGQYIDHLSTLKPLGYYYQGRNLSAVIKYVF